MLGEDFKQVLVKLIVLGGAGDDGLLDEDGELRQVAVV